ncbi:MAG TPA: Xaa-Pro aminopeptidase [Clostridiales bacterium UBA8153]|nr:Xaa-Pro aminopeptidase [Clostridiales bacterium UBA8153]
MAGCDFPWPARAPNGKEKVLALREQARIVDGWLRTRLETVLPEVMGREGFDMWVVVAREYNEDPVFLTLLPATVLSARRRTILVFYRTVQGEVERYILARSGSGEGDLYRMAWDPSTEDQWEALGRLVREKDPACIGINVSPAFALGDGLSHNEYQELMRALGPVYAARTQGAERLAVAWLERRTPQELAAYPGIVHMAHGIIGEAFSSRVVHPGVTTAHDLGWWMRQRMLELGLRAWFHSNVTVQRQGEPSADPQQPIWPGDLLHCDLGFHYLGLATDVQQLAYVLKTGEPEAPSGLTAVLETANRLQDLLAGEFVAGRTGNEVLKQSLEAARAEGIAACIYTHPLGYHGHGAGPVIGLYDQQGGVPGRGDYELFEDTCHAMELNAKGPVAEWGGQLVTMALEEDIVFTGGKVHFLAGRQTSFHLIA